MIVLRWVHSPPFRAKLDPQNTVTGQQGEGAPAGGRAAESIWNSSPEQTSEKNLNVRTLKDAWRPGQENTPESETNNRFRYADMPGDGCGGEFYKRFWQPGRLRARPPSAGFYKKIRWSSLALQGRVVDFAAISWQNTGKLLTKVIGNNKMRYDS